MNGSTFFSKMEYQAKKLKLLHQLREEILAGDCLRNTIVEDLLAYDFLTLWQEIKAANRKSLVPIIDKQIEKEEIIFNTIKNNKKLL